MNEQRRVRAVFGDLRGLTTALQGLQARGLRPYRIFSPVAIPDLRGVLPRPSSPVRWLTLGAALTGTFLGFLMAIGSALIYALIVGAKHPESPLPYCVPGFEFTILLGGVTAFFMTLWLGRLSPYAEPLDYDPRFNEDKFGLVVEAAEEQTASILALLREAGAEEVYEQPLLPE